MRLSDRRHLDDADVEAGRPSVGICNISFRRSFERAERREDPRGRRADQSQTRHRPATGLRAVRLVGVERRCHCRSLRVIINPRRWVTPFNRRQVFGQRLACRPFRRAALTLLGGERIATRVTVATPDTSKHETRTGWSGPAPPYPPHGASDLARQGERVDVNGIILQGHSELTAFERHLVA